MYSNAVNIEKGANHNKKIINGFDRRGRLTLKKILSPNFCQPSSPWGQGEFVQQYREDRK